MKHIFFVLVILVACHVSSIQSAINCDGYFVEMAKLNKMFGIDYTDRDYINRNYNADFCIYYYFKFVKSLGYDMSDLLNDEETAKEVPEKSAQTGNGSKRQEGIFSVKEV